MDLLKLSPGSHRHWRNLPDSRVSSPNILLPGKGWDGLEWRKGHQRPPKATKGHSAGSPSPSWGSQHRILKEKQESSEVKVGSAAGNGNISFFSLFCKSFPQSIPVADEEMTFIVPL